MTTSDLKLVLITGDLQIRGNGNGPKNVEKRTFMEGRFKTGLDPRGVPTG